MVLNYYWYVTIKAYLNHYVTMRYYNQHTANHFFTILYLRSKHRNAITRNNNIMYMSRDLHKVSLVGKQNYCDNYY